jgi:hypothetical protein
LANKQDSLKSPFLNGTAEDIAELSIYDRLNPTTQNLPPQNHLADALSQKRAPRFSTQTVSEGANLSLSQVITQKAKQDIQLTIHQAERAVVAGQELVQHLFYESKSPQLKIKSDKTELSEPEDFGFKTKQTPNDSQNWF